MVRGRRATSYPALRTDIRNAGGEWVDEEVVVDEGLVTSRTPDDLPAFCRALVDEVAEGRHRLAGGAGRRGQRGLLPRERRACGAAQPAAARRRPLTRRYPRRMQAGALVSGANTAGREAVRREEADA